MKEVARKIGGNFRSGGPGYGKVEGTYRGRRVEVHIKKSYNSGKGLTGLAVSYSLAQSMMGVLAGLENFTIVKVEHKARIEEPRQIRDRIFLDKDSLIYLPESSSTTGLPKMKPKKLVENIEKLVLMVEKLETTH